MVVQASQFATVQYHMQIPEQMVLTMACRIASCNVNAGSHRPFKNVVFKSAWSCDSSTSAAVVLPRGILGICSCRRRSEKAIGRQKPHVGGPHSTHIPAGPNFHRQLLAAAVVTGSDSWTSWLHIAPQGSIQEPSSIEYIIPSCIIYLISPEGSRHFISRKVSLPSSVCITCPHPDDPPTR